MREYRVCCGFGHREVIADISVALDNAVLCAIQKGCRVFMTGGDGDFDKLFAAAVRKGKRRYSNISLELIKPYYSNTWNTHKEYYTSLYDSVVVPEELACLHYKAVIRARNYWMVDHADMIIAYVHRDFGGAYTAMRYAQKKQKDILNIAANTEGLT